MLKIDELISQLNDAITRKDWVYCIDTCFRVLYGLPETTQRELAILMIQRYIPIFRVHWPDVGWPQEILNQPLEWFSEHGRDVPEQPETLNPADAAFIFCFDAILNAIAHRSDLVVVTSSYMSAINVSIEARKTNIWIADDPEGLTLWEQQGYFPGRNADENLAAMAVTEREWQIVRDWLSDDKHSEFFNIPDADEVEQGLARWKDTEMSLILPSIT